MLKAKATINGRETFVIGLSHGNLNKLKKEPLDSFIQLWREEFNIPFDILIFSGRTEADMYEFIKPLISEDTVIIKGSKKPKN